MTIGALRPAIGRIRRPSILEALALVAGLAVFINLGWDQALWDPMSQVGLHLIAAGVVVTLVLLVARGHALPRTDLERPILAVLVVLGVATLVSQNPGLGAGALAASGAFAVALPVALLAFTRRPAWAALVILLPTLWLSLMTLIQLVSRRVGWYADGAPGLLPPVRLGAETTPFGSVAVPVFVMLGLVPLTLVIESPVARRLLQASIVGLGVPLTVVSGSRSAWLAIGVAALVFALPELRHLHLRVTRPRTPGQWTTAGVVALAIGGALVFELPRLTGLTSLIYRQRLWMDTVAAWIRSPVIGVGPGTMPYARQAAAERFPIHQAHSHDIALGVLGDAGVVGLMAAVILVVAFLVVAGPHRSRGLRGRAASSVLAGYLVGGLFDDLTFLPNFTLLTVALAAIALIDAGAVTWRPLRAARAMVAAVALAATALLVIVVLRDAASLAYRAGSVAAGGRDWAASESWYNLSARLDPWHPAAPKALAVAADAAGDEAVALSAARRATELNGGDGASWLNLAILCLRGGDHLCADAAAGKAAHAVEPGGAQLVNAAILYDRLGRPFGADALYALALRQSVNVALTYRWPRSLPADSLPDGSSATSENQLTIVVARAAIRLPVVAARFSAPSVQAFVLAMHGGLKGATADLARAQRDAPDEALTWELTALLQRHWGQDPSHAAAIADLLRGEPIHSPSLPSLTWDVASFRSYPLDGLLIGVDHLVPTEAWPWSLERFLP